MSVRLRLLGMGTLVLTAALLALARGFAWHTWVFVALCFSLIGDMMMLRFAPLSSRVKDPFLWGMGAFAMAQGCYIIAFSLSLSGMQTLYARHPGTVLGADVLGPVLPVYLLAGLLYWVLMALRADRPKPLKVAALLYGELLCAMGAFACAASFAKGRFLWPLCLGGLLFILSDGVIGARLFQERFQNENTYERTVWALYVPAQVFLLLGTASLY